MPMTSQNTEFEQNIPLSLEGGAVLNAIGVFLSNFNHLTQATLVDQKHSGLEHLPPAEADVIREALAALYQLLASDSVEKQVAILREVLAAYFPEYRTEADEAGNN